MVAGKAKEKNDLLFYRTYLLDPEAEWVVFIHGAGGNMVTWKYQIEAFRPYFNLLLLDLRGHGHSQNIHPDEETYTFDLITEDVIRVLEALAIHKAHFISLSMGSIILQQLYCRRPDLIGRMVMAGGVFKANWKIRAFMLVANFLNGILPYQLLYTLFSWVVLPRKNHRKSRRIFRLQSQKLTPREYFRWIGLRKEFFQVLNKFFQTPVHKSMLIIMGAQDLVFLQSARLFARQQELARLIVFEGCGHVVTIERHRKFNKTALDFLKNDTNLATPLDPGYLRDHFKKQNK